MSDPNQPDRDHTLDAHPDVLAEIADDMRDHAALLRAFDPAGFGVPTGAQPDPERNSIAASALMRTGNLLITGLFEDTAQLLMNQYTVADDPSKMLVLADLPPAFAHLYTHTFAKRFIIVTAGVVGALHQPGMLVPGSIAERLALDMLIDTARGGLSVAENIDMNVSQEIYQPFRAAAFPDRDHVLLYQLERSDLPPVLRAEPDDDLSNDLKDWFVPAVGNGFIHPFLHDGK